jgi:hypothetical protein
MSATAQAPMKRSTSQRNGNASPPEGPEKATTRKRKPCALTGGAGDGDEGKSPSTPLHDPLQRGSPTSFCTVKVDNGAFKEIQKFFGKQSPLKRFEEAQQKFRARNPDAPETAVTSFVNWLRTSFFESNFEESDSSSSAAPRAIKYVASYDVGPTPKAVSCDPAHPGTMFTVMCSEGEDKKVRFHLPCGEKTLLALFLFSSLDNRSRVHPNDLQKDVVFPFVNMSELWHFVKESMNTESTMFKGCDVDPLVKGLFFFVLAQNPDQVEKDVGEFNPFVVFLSFLKENDLYRENALSFFLLECFFLQEVLFAETDLWSKVLRHVSSRAKKKVAV